MRKLSFSTLLICTMVVSASAQIPQTMSYQGALTDADGNVVADGAVSLIFKLYDAAENGEALWEETQQVQVTNGIFNVILGSDNPLDLPFDKPYWLGITVGSESEMSPRIALTASPYSLNSHSTIAEPAPGQGLMIRDADGVPTHTLEADGRSLHSGEAVFAGGAVIPLADSTKAQAPRVGFHVAGIDTALVAYSPNGPAIFARSGSLFVQQVLAKAQDVTGLFDGAVSGYSQEGPGVEGSSRNGPGVRGKAVNATGVVGSSETGPGIAGVSDTGSGVDGLSQNGVGGKFLSFNGTGIEASGTPAGDFHGDVEVSGEVYAKSVHVRDSQGNPLISLNADGTVEFKNDVRLSGTGAKLVFPDGSTQTTAPASGTAFDGVLENKPLIVKNASGDTLFSVATDGKSVHKGEETFLGGIKLTDANGGPGMLIDQRSILMFDKNGGAGGFLGGDQGFDSFKPVAVWDTLTVKDHQGNVVTLFAPDGTSLHKGDETFEGDIILKGERGKGVKLVDESGTTLAGFGRVDLDTGQRLGVYGHAEQAGDLAGAFDGDVDVRGEVTLSSLHLVNDNGDTLTSFNADGTSLHAGLETFNGGVAVPGGHGLRTAINSSGSTAVVEVSPTAGGASSLQGIGAANAMEAQQNPTHGIAVFDPDATRNLTGAQFEVRGESPAVFAVKSQGTPAASPSSLTKSGDPLQSISPSNPMPANSRSLLQQNSPALWGFTDLDDVTAVLGQNNSTSSALPAVWGYNAGSGVGVYAQATGSGNALQVDQQGASGNIAVFQSNGTNQARIDKTGKGFFNGGTQTGGADVAEAFEVEGVVDAYEPGDVIAISPENDRTVTKSTEPYSTSVIGVYATKPGLLLTERVIDDRHEDTIPVGVVGVIPTKVCAENGPIRRGDLLVTSSIPGHAMKGNQSEMKFGAIIGKALEGFQGRGTGVIRVLVNVK